MKKNKLIVIVPLYNVEKWIKYCVRSIKAQQYDNYHCYLIDDISTDSTSDIIEQEISGNDNFTLIKNVDKKYALLNIYDTIADNNLEDEDIVVLLDGDDWFANPNVLNTVNEAYNSKKCLFTYGSYIEYPSNTIGKFAKQIPNSVIEQSSYRSSEWMSSHLRTFKCKLWNKIHKKDLINSKTNKFYKAAWDLAFVFPMLEMAAERALYLNEVLYVYNRQNPLNEDKINHSLQLNEENEIRNKDKYEKLGEEF